MRAWKLAVLVLIIVIFLLPSSALAQDNTQFSVVSVIDRTFYGNQCDKPEWAWLCMRKRADIAALGEKDGWEMIADDLFTDSNESQSCEFTLASSISPEVTISKAVLKIALHNINSSSAIGFVKLWGKIDDKWQLLELYEDAGYSLVIFGGPANETQEINLAKSNSQFLNPQILNGLKLKFLVVPASTTGVLTAIDQIVLSVDYSGHVEATSTPTPTSTPMLTITPTPTLTPTPTPTPTLTPSDQEKPEVSWLNPTENEVVFGKVALKVDMSDDSDDIDEEVYPQFFYRRLSWEQWEAISGKTWDTKNISLGDYQLRVRVCDQVGNEKLEEINVGVGAAISNVFLTERVLSWYTDRPTIGRVIYDRLSHQNVNPNYPNFDYAWSSGEVDNNKTTNHQFVIPSLPPGKYYYRILAFGSPVSYTPEYSFESDNLLSFNNMEDESLILGSVVSATPSVSKEVEVKEETKETSGLGKRRFLVLVMAGFLCSLGIFYLTKNKKKILMKDNEK